MWLSVVASILAIGGAFVVVYYIYLKMDHPDVIYTEAKRIPDFILDSFASLVQSEQPPMFRVKPTLSAGKIFENFLNKKTVKPERKITSE